MLVVNLFMQSQLNCVHDVSFTTRGEFFVPSSDFVFCHLWLTSLSKMTSSLWNWLFFTLIQRDEVKWVQVTLFEGYLRAANEAIIKQILNQNIISQHLIKRSFLFWFLYSLFETGDLQSCCGYSQIICQLCYFLVKIIERIEETLSLK